MPQRFPEDKIRFSPKIRQEDISFARNSRKGSLDSHIQRDTYHHPGMVRNESFACWRPQGIYDRMLNFRDVLQLLNPRTVTTQWHYHTWHTFIPLFSYLDPHSFTPGGIISHTSCTFQSSYSYPYDRTYITLFFFMRGHLFGVRKLMGWGWFTFFFFLLLYYWLLSYLFTFKPLISCSWHGQWASMLAVQEHGLHNRAPATCSDNWYIFFCPAPFTSFLRGKVLPLATTGYCNCDEGSER